MSPNLSTTIAIWVLEHTVSSPSRSALAGDLLEQFHGGRSHAWIWRQVLSVLAIKAVEGMHALIAPVIFSLAWGMVFSAWTLSGAGHIDFALPQAAAGTAWPATAIVEIGSSLSPVVFFVWVGALLYMLLRPEVLREISLFRVLSGLSFSLNVLLVFSVSLLHHFGHSQPDLQMMARRDFFAVDSVAGINFPVAMSLLAGLLCMTSTSSRIVRRKRTSSGGRPGAWKRSIPTAGLLLLVCAHGRMQAQSVDAAKPAAPKAQMISVDKDVQLEALDWGGDGRPLILLAGLGNDAHVYDRLAPKLALKYHVYGITRRGFGASSKPAPTIANYTADRLGDDVLAVIDALQLKKPVLVGHSLAGEELSSMGTRHPEKIAGLVYLDAAYGFAYYDAAHGDSVFDLFSLQRHLEDFVSGAVHDQRAFMVELQASAAQFQSDLKDAIARDPSVPELHAPRGPLPPVLSAIHMGAQKYGAMHVPILAIFACPHNFDFDRSLRNDPAEKAAVVASDTVITARQADAFAAGEPSARVVRIANADHYVFNSNEAQVLDEMDHFLAKLPN